MRYIESCGLEEVDGLAVGVVRFTETMEVLSCAVLNGGLSEADAYFIMPVPHDYDHDDPRAHAAEVRDALGLPGNTVGMMTAAEVGYVFNVQETERNGTFVTAVATAGLSNHVMAGDVLEDWESRHVTSLKRAARMMAGTINVALVVESPLTMEGKVNLFMPVIEGKSAALADRGFKETGTTSDSVAIISPKGDGPLTYTGTGSDLGIAGGRAVRAAVGHALCVRGEFPEPEDPMKLLSKLGYDEEVLWTMSGTGMTREEYSESLREYLSYPRTRTVLDMFHYVSDRADSLYADGDECIIQLFEDLSVSEFGFVPDFEKGIMDGLIMSMATEAGRRF